MPRLRWQLYRSPGPPHPLRAAVVLVVVFTVLVFIARFAFIDRNDSTVFWPANGALVVALLSLSWRLSVPVLVACLSVNLAVNVFSNYSLFDDVRFSILNIAVSLTVALLTRNLCGARIDLSRFRRMTIFGIIAFGAAGLEATLGELIDRNATIWTVSFSDTLQWTLCDGFGLLIATPAILLCIAGADDAYPCDAGRLERWLLLTTTACLTAVSFYVARSPTFMLIYPLLILTAFRAGPRWVLASILITSLISSALTIHGYGPIALLSSHSVMLDQGMAQPFLISIFLCAVPANNALGEKSRSVRRMLQMKEAVEHAATHDTLTTLVNRDLFRVRLGNLLRNGDGFVVLYVDLDRFKLVNDTMGHSAGDQLLRTFSARMLTIVDRTVTVARFGGDEFAMLVPYRPSQTELEKICHSIIDVARAPFLLATGPAHVSASIGVALGPGSASDVSELMRRADIALYAAKAAGRDGYCLFCKELDRMSRDRVELKADLEAALTSFDQFRLVYQVKVGADDVVRGVEALLRWHHPTRGEVPTQDAIELAEEMGLIIPLGAWVLREALGFAARWPTLTVAINVSPVQLRHRDYVSGVLELLRTSPIGQGRIELEITETALMDDIDGTAGKLATLRAAGLRIALDDFGTGFSSLRHLHRCVVDRVKIDRSFVEALSQSEKAAAIVRAVIQLGHAMGLQVTAEGVETEAQRLFLLAADVDELQGYVFAQPVAEALLTMIQDQRRPWSLEGSQTPDPVPSDDRAQTGPSRTSGMAA
ncbi:MAG: putative bifunctional diguanylate cyclase/phosphodiesterase [Janthinobacterium lividum]